MGKLFVVLTLTLISGSVWGQDLEIEPNNSSTQATALTSGTQLQGSLFDRNDQDYYVLTLTESQEVTISVTTTARERFSEMTLEVSIFDTNQSKVGGFTSEVSTEVDTKLIAGPGSVYVRVAVTGSRFEGSLKYFIKAIGIPVSSTPTVELEPNNSSTQATTLTSGVQLQGSLFDRNDQDYYVLTLTESQEVTISVTTTARERFSEMTLEVSIFDMNQSKVGGFTSEVSTEVDTKLIAGSGSVYVRVTVTGSRFEGSLKYFIKAIFQQTFAPDIALSAQTLMFSEVGISQSKELNLSVSNQGNRNLNVTSINTVNSFKKGF